MSILIPLWSPFWAFVAVALLFIGVAAYKTCVQKKVDPEFRLRNLFRLAFQIGLLPAAYIAKHRPFPGTWNPGKKIHTARRTLNGLLACWALFFSVSLSLYFPWDAPYFGPRSTAMFHGDLTKNAIHMAIIEGLAPNVDWRLLPAPYTPPPGTPTLEDVYRNHYGKDTPQDKIAVARYADQVRQRQQVEAQIDAFVTHALNRSPYLWPYLAIVGLINGDFYFTLPLLIALILMIAFPPIFLAVVLFDPLSDMFILKQQLDAMAMETEKKCTRWACYVERLRTSTHKASDPVDSSKAVAEAQHLFMGCEPVQEFPILLDKSILTQHTYILGGTGFGKTSLGVMPLVMQLLQGHVEPDPNDRQKTRTTLMPPMLIIDLKEDKALFHTVRETVRQQAAEEGRSLQDAFRVFSCQIGHACHAFNPFDDLGSARHSMVELCNVYLDALNLNHGEGYGRSYYTMKSRSLLYNVLKNDHPKNFQQLYESLVREKNKPEFREAYELVATVEALSDYEHIFNPTHHKGEPTIHMPTAVRERQVVYFWLPAAEHSLTAKEITSLALYTFYNAVREWSESNERRQHGLSRHDAYLVIDEFQRVASRNFPNILREARAFGLGLILAHQSMSDLQLPDIDLASIVRENTRLKLFFAIQDPAERELFTKLSGQELAIQPSKGYKLRKKTIRVPKMKGYDTTEVEYIEPSYSFTPILKTRITTNDIIETSDYPFDYFMLVGQGSGYTQFGGYPIPVRTSWPLPTEVYKSRLDLPWPTADELGLPKTAKPTALPVSATDDKRAEEISKIDSIVEQLFKDDPSLHH